MGGDHGGKVVLPDHKIWKWEGTPLEATQQRLARRGLRDPWMRNEAWRYTGSFGVPVKFTDVIFRGFKKGFIVFAVALAVEYAFFPPKKSEHH